MRAVAITHHLPITDEHALLDVTLPDPTPGPHDLLVRVHAVSVNPVDTKVRAPKDAVNDPPRVLGWDAAGVVQGFGEAVTGFEVGDKVYYAGDLTRPGSNAELQAVDARIVAKMPHTLDFAQAAALPLTALTAWEALFDRMNISPLGDDAGKTILLVGGAGGVGSIAIQLATKLAKLRVIATATRPESIAWARELGAEAIISHHEPLDEGLKAAGIGEVDYILCMNSTGQHFDAMCRAIAPQGTIASIVELSEPVNLGALMRKSARFVWELMFTRSLFQTADMDQQGIILAHIADLIDAQTLRATAQESLTPISAATLRQAHAQLEGGHTVGKVVLEGWS